MNITFRVIIAGTRTFNNYTLLKEKCDFYLDEKLKSHEVTIISGTCKGADLLGERYAKEKGLGIKKFPADWDKHGKKAGAVRNIEMANNADALICFWDGQSKGAGMMIEIAKQKGLIVKVVKPTQNSLNQ